MSKVRVVILVVLAMVAGAAGMFVLGYGMGAVNDHGSRVCSITEDGQLTDCAGRKLDYSGGEWK